jgi:heat shock protein HtpX
MIEELSRNSGLIKPKLYMVDMPVPNAFATGRNEKNSVVALSSAIINLLSNEELRGVLAHELSHIKNKDILISTIAATLAGTISYIAQMVYFNGGNRDGRNNIFAVIAMAIVTPIIAGILRMAISRSREYLADETGARMAKDSSGLSSALKKLHSYSEGNKLIGEPRHEATAHMFIVNPFKGSTLLSLFSTHPPMHERVRRLERIIIN